jgi:subfamily B ATP-binding cassette protein HlyB/CyaB
MCQQEHLHGDFRYDEILWLLGSLCGLFRIPFDAKLVAQDFPHPFTRVSLHEAARALGIKTGQGLVSQLGRQIFPLPAIAFERSVQADADPPVCAGEGSQIVLGTPVPEPPELLPSPPLTVLLLVKASTDTLLYFRPGSQTPETMPLSEAAERLEPDLLRVAKESTAEPGEAIADFSPEQKRFGFSWFIPELLKHKSIWRDVLLASLAIQLVGLVTPVFTQIIIDKVIVHQSSSTLIVLGVALVMFMLFTSFTTWLRQYLVLHTGNRIDAVLGSQVLRHLLRLPLPYFEYRSTGVLVARMQGVETIREFVSGAAVTLVLDFPFLLIFLAVMFAYLGACALTLLTLSDGLIDSETGKVFHTRPGFSLVGVDGNGQSSVLV